MVPYWLHICTPTKRRPRIQLERLHSKYPNVTRVRPQTATLMNAQWQVASLAASLDKLCLRTSPFSDRGVPSCEIGSRGSWATPNWPHQVDPANVYILPKPCQRPSGDSVKIQAERRVQCCGLYGPCHHRTLLKLSVHHCPSKAHSRTARPHGTMRRYVLPLIYFRSTHSIEEADLYSRLVASTYCLHYRVGPRPACRRCPFSIGRVLQIQCASQEWPTWRKTLVQRLFMRNTVRGVSAACNRPTVPDTTSPHTYLPIFSTPPNVHRSASALSIFPSHLLKRRPDSV